MIYLYVVLMGYANSFWALHFTFKRRNKTKNISILLISFTFISFTSGFQSRGLIQQARVFLFADQRCINSGQTDGVRLCMCGRLQCSSLQPKLRGLRERRYAR